MLVTACGGGRDLGPGGASVVRVVDGDTIVVLIDGREEKVRLIGIDTPESVDPRRPVECFGQQASDYLAQLLPPTTIVRLIGDAEQRDRYGRLLAYVYRSSDNLFVNLDVIRNGYANSLTIAPNVSHTEEFRAAERLARDEDIGLWSACAGPANR